VSSEKYAPQLSIDLQPAKTVLAALLLIHVGAIGLTLPMTLPLWAKMLVVSAVLMSLLLSLGKNGWISRPGGELNRWLGGCRIQRLHWDREDNIWYLQSGPDGPQTSARLLPGSYCHARLVVLNFKTEAARWYQRGPSVVITPDATDKNTFKQLRVLLRLQPPGPQDSLAE
jgi:hypothetical protein